MLSVFVLKAVPAARLPSPSKLAGHFPCLYKKLNVFHTFNHATAKTRPGWGLLLRSRALMLLLLALPKSAWAEVPEFESQGVYVKSGSDYMPAMPIVGVQSLSYNFGHYIMTLLMSNDIGEQLDVIVFKEAFG